jgi:hypothetical protein
MATINIGTVSITIIVDLIPRTIGNVRLPTALSPFKSPMSPSGPKIKKKAKKNNEAYMMGGREEKMNISV